MSQREHVEQLAAELGVKLTFDADPQVGPVANTIDRTVRLPKWGSEPGHPTYWSALHELGHIVDAPPPRNFMESFFGSPRIVAAEARAWEWAIQNSKWPLDEEARASIAYSLATYAPMGLPRDTTAVEFVARTVGPVPNEAFGRVSRGDWIGHEDELIASWGRLVALVQEPVAA